jgi:DNA-binding transcriptional LysR family regulator
MSEKLADLQGLPSLRQLRCFALAIEHGSIGRAADEIGMSQPAASHAIARLERRLGVELLVRSSGGCRASRAGEQLAIRTARFLARLEQGLLTVCADAALSARLVHNLRMVHLRAHIAVAETGNFAQSARALGVSAPALNRAAHDLEQLLRRRLYRVGTSGIGLSAAGDNLARQMRLAAQELLQAFEEIGHRTAVSIVVGVLPLMPKRWIMRALAQTKAPYPDVLIEIRVGDFANLLKDLRSGNVDVILGGIPGGYSVLDGDVVQEPLFADPYVLVVRQSHPLSGVRPIEPIMLTRYEWVVPTDNVPRLRAIERFFTTLPVRPKVWLKTTSPGVMWGALAETDCMTLVSSAHLFIDGPRDLAVLPVEIPHQGRMVGIYKRKDWLPTAVQQRFLTALSETPLDREWPWPNRLTVCDLH